MIYRRKNGRKEYNMIDEFVAWAINNGWSVELAESLHEIPVLLTQRYRSLPRTWSDFFRAINSCHNAQDTVWFTDHQSFRTDDDNAFRYNELELISLDAACGDAELENDIRSFWNKHIPIVMSVSNGYEYYAINTDTGEIVNGYEPEFEECSHTADTFYDFLKMIVSGEIII